MGRHLQRAYNTGKEQAVLMMPILEGLDGVQKMSKSLNNYIGITEEAKDIYAKTLSVSDDLMWRYYELLSEKSLEEIAQLKEDVQNRTVHPKVAKENLALELVTRFYNEESATLAKAEFDNVFKSNQLPADMAEIVAEEGIWICKALVDAGIEPSTSQARRDIKQNAVSVDQKKISDEKMNLEKGEYILQVGKRKFAKVKVG
jgi:tyrosyl-tRNA synthetase